MADQKMLVAAVWTFVCWSTIFSQDTRLPLLGSKISVQDAATHAEDVFLAKLLDLGSTDPVSAAGAGYSAKVQIIKNLKGNKGGILTVEIFVINQRQSREEAPVNGVNYIFFVHKDVSSALLIVDKMLSADAAVIDKLTKIIAAGH